LQEIPQKKDEGMYKSLPQELKEKGLFRLWKFGTNKEKTTKIPYSISGKKAKANKKTSFSPFKGVVSHLKGYSGIGVGIFNDLAGVDIDDCIDESGELSERAKKIVKMMNSYTEKSPSGKGIRIIFKVKDFVFDKEKHYIKNYPIGVEVYIAGITSRFLTVTDNAINELGLEDRGNEIQAVLDEFMVRPNEI
jgi:putative DNA primase/helicase